jgi:HEAT repeat protein
MGPTAKDAVPALLEVWKEPDNPNHTPAEAAEALGQIGAAAREAVPALMDVLRAPDYQSNKPRAALYALHHIGPPAREAVPVLVDLLPGPLGFRAAETLDRIDPESESTRRLVVTVWIRRLEDPEHGDHLELDRAAKGLAELGPAGLPILVQLLGKRGLAQRNRMVEGLGRYGPAAVPALTMALLDPDVSVRLLVPGALQTAGAAGVPALIQALKDTDAGVRMNSALVLGRIGRGARDAVPALVAQAEYDRWFGARMQAIDAIGLIGPEGQAVAPQLRHVLANDPNPEVRRRAETALRVIGEGPR